MQHRRRKKIKAANLQFRQLHPQVNLHRAAIRFAKEPEKIAQVERPFVLHQVGVADLGQVSCALDGGVEVTQFIHEPQLIRLPARQHPAIGVVPPVIRQLAAFTAVLFVGPFAAFGDHFLETFECFINQRLHHLFFLGQDFVLIFLAAQHIFELAALEHLWPNADLVQQPAIIVTVHDDADAPGDRQFVGHDPLAGRRDIVTARCRQTPHRGHGRLFVILLKISDRAVNFVRGQHLAARRIHSQNDGLYRVILARPAQLVGNQVHQAAAAAVPRFAGNDPGDVQKGDLVLRMVVLEHHLFQMLPRLPTGLCRDRYAMDQMPQIAQNTQQKQNAEHNGYPHPTASLARRSWRRRWRDQWRGGRRNNRRRRRLALHMRDIVFHIGGKLSQGTTAGKSDSLVSHPKTRRDDTPDRTAYGLRPIAGNGLQSLD